MRRRSKSPVAQAQRDSIDCRLAKWPRILRVQTLATSCGGGGSQVIAVGLPDWTCAACDATRLGSLAQAAYRSAPLYFRCAECGSPLHSPIVCSCVVRSEEEGVLFCSKMCKDSFDDENTRVCDLARPPAVPLAQAPAIVHQVPALAPPAPPALAPVSILISLVLSPSRGANTAVLALVCTALVIGLSKEAFSLVPVLILTLFN